MATVAIPPKKPALPWNARIGRFINGKAFAYICIAPVVIAMAVLIFYPMVQGILYSFTNANDSNIGGHIGPNVIPATYKSVGLQNYIDILTNKASGSVQFAGLLLQTFIWVAGCVVFHVLFGVGLAMLLNRNIRFRGGYRAIMMIPWAMPQYVAALAWSFFLNQNYGIINVTLTNMHLAAIPWTTDPNWARFAVIMVNTWLGVPFYVVTVLGGLQSIPAELNEAAAIDGASWWQRFRNVTLPMLRPILGLVMLLDTIWTFNLFAVIYFITGGAPGHASDTIISYAYENPITTHNYGIGAAYGMIILVILMVFTIGYSRAVRVSQGVN